VVYGDIGTSPLYTIKEIFAPHTGVPWMRHHLIGALSSVLWALMLVVTLKYVVLILRADNHGEGGGLALTALAAQAVRDATRPAHGVAAAGGLRCHAVLWRQHHHAGHLGARRDGGAGGGHAHAQPYVVPIRC
jgi:K+ transporter